MADTPETHTIDSAEDKGVADAYDKFGDLPDAPPKQGIKLSWVGKSAVGVILFWIIMGFIGPWVAPYDEANMDAEDGYMPSYLKHIQCEGKEIDEDDGSYCADYDADYYGEGTQVNWMGSDYLGRDTLSRIIWGARTTIGISFLATLIAYMIGITAGIAAAVKGGWWDMGMSRFNDAILSLPTIMLGLIIIAAMGSSIPILIGTAAVIYAASVFRIARALGQDIMVWDYVEVAKARGEGLWWIIKSEVLPNAAMPLATDFGLRLVFVVLFISSLSFLGLGVQPPTADWGSMVRENLQGLGYGSYAAIWPALAIASFTISINLVVDDISAKDGGSLAKKMV
jgi:peptide/nickel transport system permease protein